MSFTGEMKRAGRRLGEFSIKDLAAEMGVRDKEKREDLYTNASTFTRHGLWERIGRALYRHVGGDREEATSLWQRLWDIARRMMRFSVDDLVQITGGNRAYIWNFCSFMVKAGYARRVKRGRFEIIKELKPDAPSSRA